MSVSNLCSVYSNADRGGDVRLIGVDGSSRYRRFGADELADISMYRRISSAEVFGSASADGVLLLFGGPFGLTFGDYNGLFAQLTKSEADGSFWSNLPGPLNDIAQSLLLVATQRESEFRMSFRDMFLDEWKETIDAELGDDAERKGDPTLTWEMFPRGISHLNPEHIYLKVHQKLNIVLDWWPDYDATITYHIRLFVSGGHVAGHVQRWAYWVEGGVKSDDIAEELEPKVIAGMETINEKLAERLSAAASFTVSDLYLLPGRQLSPAGTGLTSGTTWDDVTIVVAI